MKDDEKKKTPLKKVAKSILKGRLLRSDDKIKPVSSDDSESKDTEAFDITSSSAWEDRSLASSGSDEALVSTPEGELILPVVPVREGVLFPSTESVLTFGRPASIEAIKASKYTGHRVMLVTQKNPETNHPNQEDVYQIGTLAIVERTLTTDGQLNALVRGTDRARIIRFIKSKPTITAQVQVIKDTTVADDETKALAGHVQKEFRKAVHLGKPVEFLNFMKLMSGVTEGELVDQIASTLTIETDEKQKILETLDVKARLRRVIEHLSNETKVMEIEKDVAHKTQAKFDKYMRENVLRERLKTIKKELGELDDDEEVIDEYQAKLKKLKKHLTNKAILTKLDREIKRLQMMSPNNPEAGYVRTWLDTVFDLPWNKYQQGSISLDKAREILDKNHFGLEEVKDRIIEYMAVLQLKQQAQKKGTVKAIGKGSQVPTILCFVGPPGVGKTSIGRSIAQALGRTFVKVSLGGVRDEAEIRGHRRTYVGAMTGRILSGMKQAGSMNPVFMLDEVDKLGNDFRGDPSAALLEALDPEQNNGFEDHYLDMPFDLSQVIFITTANTLDTIPSALRDRLEIIRYAGYTEDEKFHIAQDHLLQKVIEQNGLKPTAVEVPAESIHYVIQRYTREAGVRLLERTLSKMLRKVAVLVAKNTGKRLSKFALVPKKVTELLGPEEYDVTLTEEEDQVGLATGLAWTSVGGDVLFIEVALTPGKGLVQLTGQLGDVMKESAQAALTYVKANAKKLGIKTDLSKTDVHIHVPEGAVPKDGPSAGVTMTTAIVSALTDTPVKREVAMTGEVTLRGRVLRIGGLKEKSIAAHRAGAKIVLIPRDNERDMEKIPDSVKKDIKFIPATTMDDVLKVALKHATLKS